MKKIILFICFLSINAASSFAQPASDSLLQAGNIFYKQKDFAKAGSIWVKAAEAADNNITKNTIYYYVANAFAKANDSTSVLTYLNIAVKKHGFNDLAALNSDDSFDFMRKSPNWKKLIHLIKPTYSTNPLKAKFFDTDVRNFWAAYDVVLRDSIHASELYKKLYIDKGTNALQDYYVNKMGGNMIGFVYTHNKKKRFYASIRSNTLKTMNYNSQYQQCFVALKKLYPAALFPDVYFLIGKLNSAGTTTSNGLMLAVDQLCKTSTTDTSELESWEKHYLSPFSNLVPTVAHELIHFQQNGMAADTTLLKEAILEGMADFLGELISGKSSNERLKIFTKGKEKTIWADFKKEMFLDRKQNWIANGDQETADKPADLGYWVGYRICKAYYNNAADKKKAVHDMLNIQDYKKFLADSKVEEEMK